MAGVTDRSWFEYLASINLDEVNFWKPDEQGPGAIEIGATFLFKIYKRVVLKSYKAREPQNYYYLTELIILAN